MEHENSTVRYLEEVKAALGLKNDTQLAEALDISRQAVSNYRKGTHMSPKVAVTVAKILKISPMVPLADTMTDQSSERDAMFWQEIRQHFAERGDPTQDPDYAQQLRTEMEEERALFELQKAAKRPRGKGGS
jgi:transcriptional regulator with XRE-family HTH domain